MNETPILIGVAQVSQRQADPAQAKEPLDLMLQATRAAELDTQCANLLEKTNSVRVVRGLWPYKNPAKVVAQSIGATNAQTMLTPYGGNFVQSTINQSALDIQTGHQDIIVITGAECGYTQAKAAKAKFDLNWLEAPGEPDAIIGEDKPMVHAAEKTIRVGQPIRMYPVFEIALRHHLGESVSEHIERVSQLWASFSAVAKDNPNAWIRDPLSAEEIRTPSAANRAVSYPYPKFMNSNNNVDQGAAVIMCSVSKAKALGIPESQWVYPWAGTDAHDHLAVSHRDNLYSSPAIRLAGNRCLELAGVEAGQLDTVDLYSCFPVAVQIAARELGLTKRTPLTVTGGLTFAGGPLNNYVMHAVCRTVDLARTTPGSKGLVTANGGFLTKHAFGVYSTEAPSKPFQHQDLQAEVDKLPAREALLEYSGPATVEGYSVMFGNDGPEVAHIACMTPEGKRTWANCHDQEVLPAMIAEEFCGRSVQVNELTAAF